MIRKTIQGVPNRRGDAWAHALLAKKMTNPADDLVAMNGSFPLDHGVDNLGKLFPVDLLYVEIERKLTCGK